MRMLSVRSGKCGEVYEAGCGKQDIPLLAKEGNVPHKLSFFQFSGLREWHDVTVLMKPAYV
jgi:hypothetical protein